MSVKLDAKTVHDRLTSWLVNTKPSWEGLTVAPMDVVLGSGFSAEIFFVDVDYTEAGQHFHRTLVVRRQPQTFEVVFESDLKLQANMMAALDARGDLPVPPWVGKEDDASILGAPFLVMGRVEGQAATQRPNYNVEGWLTQRTPAERLTHFTNALTALAKLHEVDWQDGFKFLNRPDRGAPGLEQYLGYLVDWHAARGQGRKLPIVDAAMQWVLENRPDNTDTCVLWGDPTPSNVMWRPDGSVAALIDWELAALGPRELDLAWWLYFDDLFSRRFGVTRLEGLPTRDETVAIYEKAAGRKVGNLDYYDVVVALRMALVAVGAFDRQVSLGNIAATNTSADNNLMTLYIAEKLGLPLPELGNDFRDFMRNLTPVEEAAD
ncbi:phosphotransferase family protein [Novosphingobium sp. CECT 9465]|uniref:phosphotransferase family protein n=1 Tax=Novosphingobium sp. CECT 9465 TaxID=2829794 RepID=UPI001E5F28EA|nr:phosphotransferase family protein [Novosphingobium sp. CECT 9465]CAH0498107.1 Putative aminoglycoside phosphotransferase [Novosphingobium sp. CECT 9465]